MEVYIPRRSNMRNIKKFCEPKNFLKLSFKCIHVTPNMSYFTVIVLNAGTLRLIQQYRSNSVCSGSAPVAFIFNIIGKSVEQVRTLLHFRFTGYGEFQK